MQSLIKIRELNFLFPRHESIKGGKTKPPFDIKWPQREDEMADNKNRLKEILENIEEMLEEKYGEGAGNLEIIVEDMMSDSDNDKVQFKDGEKNIEMPTIALRGLTVFPSVVMHFDIGREKSIKALERAMVLDQHVFLVTQKNENTELPTREDLFDIGTVVRIKQMLKLPGDSVRVLVEGKHRAVLEEMVQEIPYFQCRIRILDDQGPSEISAETEALMRTVLNNFEEYLDYTEKNSRDVMSTILSIEEPGRMADLIASHIHIKAEDKQKVLDAIEYNERLEELNKILLKEIEILTIEEDINKRVKSQINKNQKEYYLREQMKAIQEELGVSEDVDDEIDAWRKKIKKLKLHGKIADKLEKEINRFSKMQPSSAEGNVTRTYIETILDLPWNKSSKTKFDLNAAQKILDEDHFGLEKVKERVLEYLAVVELSGGIKGPILCLVGPPGVGKTSIARSVARSINREFVRMSLGGVRDEAEIRGHRRTYIGAIPGRIISCMKDAGTNNPVFLFDEVDKIGADFKGDPASALLEVLDPEQNKEFVDHYLEVPFDLSKVMFITTANTTDTIPRPLLDRMEVINVSGYTEEEKVKIAEKYLVPKKVKEHGLKEENIKISELAIRDLINYYTRESGVRNLEREIANLCRKVALKTVTKKKANYRITPKTLEEYLGKKRFRYDIIEGKEEVGVTTGLAWTIVGGDTLFIEIAVIPGSGKLVLTGQLGDVMQESAKAAVSYIRSVSEKLGIEENFYKEKDLHIHIPEGATPKDGPSAGVTMCTAIISSLTGRPARKDIAMTGEITLRGKVLPVGGIREKVLAAHRAGIKKVLLPMENEKDIEEIPINVRRKMEFVLIENVDEAIKHVLK